MKAGCMAVWSYMTLPVILPFVSFGSVDLSHDVNRKSKSNIIRYKVTGYGKITCFIFTICSPGGFYIDKKEE
jgi:hypothetical protein